MRRLKEGHGNKSEVTAAIAQLKACKKALESTEKSLSPPTKSLFDKAGLEDLMKRRFFVAPSFSIYGGESNPTPHCMTLCRGGWPV